MEKQIQAIRTDFQSRIQFLESQLQAAGVLVDPVVAPSNPLHRLWIHLAVIPLFGQCHINNNLMHFHPKRFTFQRKRRRIRRRRRTNKSTNIYPDDPLKTTDQTRRLGLIVCRGTAVMLVSPTDGIDEITNPFIQPDGPLPSCSTKVGFFLFSPLMETIEHDADSDNQHEKTGSYMEGIQVILVQKESIDDQQPGQEEQYSVQFFQTKEIQVSQENPSNIPDVEKQFLGNQHQHLVLEKLNTKCTKEAVSSTKTSVGPRTEAKLPSKRHCGQEKPIEELATLLPPSSKRQKTSEMISDQSIEQFNNVTAVSEFNLEEEQEKLFSGSLVGRQVSKLSLRVVQGKEEGMLVLQKSPLRGRLAKIICGGKNARRLDFEKRRQNTLVTSDIRHQVEVINRKVKEDWEKQQTEEIEHCIGFC
ncbi:unnamed protein product [Camellia sinensis]